jgi:prepilin-type N-terminal cleavage/methylation domain-containing protein
MMIKKNKGFTLVELMMVMVVMALVATLATGAAMKSIKQGKERKIDATCVALRMALTNYRANEQCWPVPLEPLGDSTTVTFHENNAKVFAPLLVDRKKLYLDPSALLTKVSGFGVIPLRVAMDRKIAPEACSLGYADPSNGNIFKYYKVTFNLSMDTASVGRSD